MVPFRPRPGRVARPVRRRLPRRAVPWWAATVALAVATGLVADGLLQRVTDAEARWGATRLAGRLPPGTRAVLVPLEASGLPVRVGDHVDLLGVTSPDAPVAGAATVVEVRADALVVAVAPTAAVALAGALGQGPLVPALVSAADR